MAKTFSINTDAAVVFTNKLEKLHRSGLPVAIRQTLSSAAFDVKTRTMPASSGQAFTLRKKNFFRANSRVIKASGFDINTMRSTVGFISRSSGKGADAAVKELMQQEFGGTIAGRSFIPTDIARGGNNSKPVKPVNRLSRINLVNSANVKGSNRKERFIKSAIHARKGGFILGSFQKKQLLKIKSIRRKGANTVVKTDVIYTFKKNRKVGIPATGFMRRATNKSARNMEKWYEKEAKKQILRLTK